jgi:hypothetical protein
MNARISAFINLPLGSLDRLTLQKRLDAIGRRGGEGEEPSTDTAA